MVQASTRLVYFQTLLDLRLVARKAHSQSCRLGCAESLQKDQQSYEDDGSSAFTDIELVPVVENPNDINSVNMFNFDSCFDDLSLDATTVVQNVGKQTSEKKNTRRSSSTLTLTLEPREVVVEY